MGSTHGSVRERYHLGLIVDVSVGFLLALAIGLKFGFLLGIEMGGIVGFTPGFYTPLLDGWV